VSFDDDSQNALQAASENANNPEDVREFSKKLIEEGKASLEEDDAAEANMSIDPSLGGEAADESQE